MSELKINGTITEVLKVESGTTKAGKEWQKLTFILDTKAQYNPLVAFSLFGTEKVENFNKYNKVGQEVEVSFNISSREHEGKWYSSIDAWMVKSKGETKQPELNSSDAEEDFDLPF